MIRSRIKTRLRIKPANVGIFTLTKNKMNVNIPAAGSVVTIGLDRVCARSR